MAKIRQSIRRAAFISLRSYALAGLLGAWFGQVRAQEAPRWVTLWQDSYKDKPAKFDPERISAVIFADRTTGDAFLSMWNFGVWRSSDGGKTFARVDGGKISGEGCGPIGPSAQISPEGKKMALFNMNNAPGPSGYSIDGGRTWESFEAVGRNWDFGAMDWDSKTVLAARHEDDGLHLSLDAGKTWARLARSRGNPFITGLGVAGPKALLLATGNSIERSTDDGATWVKVAGLGAVGPALRLKDRIWWLSGEGKKSVIFSTDQGQTWSVQGEPLPAPAVSGPQFGKDESHIVAAAKAGFYETTDGCKSWKLAVPVPEGYTLQSAAFDPVHDIFYLLGLDLANRARSVMRYERSGDPKQAGPAAVAAEARPRLNAEFVDAPRPRIRVLNPLSVDFYGDYFYVGGEDGIVHFRRDLQTGKLAFVDQIGEPRCGGYTIRCAGGRLYAVTPHDGYRRMNWHGLAWFEFDSQTGKPHKKGIVACPASRQVVVGSDQKDLYLKACGGRGDKLFWYRIDAEGKPAHAGEVTGKGIGPSSHGNCPSILQMAPDGRDLYCISAEDYAIACIQRKPNGEIAYRGAAGLEPVAQRDPDNYRYQWVALAVSPDGKWLYAAVRNGKPTENFYGIFKRDLNTGDLSFQEAMSGDKDPLANQPAWNMVFAANGTEGYLGSWTGPLLTFQYDPQTGHLTHPGAVTETNGYGAPHLLLDADHGFLYGAGGEIGTVVGTLFVLKVGTRR